MVHQRVKNKVSKSKQVFTYDGVSNNEVQIWKLKVGHKTCARQRDELNPQHLLKYFLIGIWFVVLGFWLNITSVYFMDNLAFLLERSDIYSVRQQEVTHKLKKEPASDVEQTKTRSERECVAGSKLLSEGSCLFTAKKQKRYGINMLVQEKEERKLYGLLEKRLTKECMEISDDRLLITTNEMENETNIGKGKNKKSPVEYCSRSLSNKKSFSEVSLASEPIILKPKLHSKKHSSRKNHENFLKMETEKEKETKYSPETITEAKPKNYENKPKKMKKKENESKSQNDYLPSEIRNFKSTIQRMFVPNRILADRREITPIEVMPQKPHNSSVKVFMFEGFLSDYECDNLRRVHDNHVHLMSKEEPILCFDSVKTLQLHLKSAGKSHIRVSRRDFTKDTRCVNRTFSSQLKKWLKVNWSYSTAFYPGENYFSKIYEQRVQRAMGLNPENGGKFQITSYPKGIGYKKHTDCIENSSDRRDRMVTVLVYLDTVKKGGQTRFPELGISVKPRKGRALVWNNMDEDGHCESLSVHVADRVSDGHKYILQRWYYYQSFYSLGKRPPRTDKPKRSYGQARVSCDEYAHGSCRWYDEWNHDHLVRYHRNNSIKI